MTANKHPTPTTLSRLPDPADPVVLLVDDTRSWHLAMGRWRCERHGRVCMNWLHASNAREATELLELRGAVVALVVSDHRMPGQSGMDFLAEVGRRWPTVRRLLLTSWLDGDKVARADFECLSKDLDGAFLLDKICRLSRGLP